MENGHREPRLTLLTALADHFGVEVEDLVHYALPFDPLSRPLHPLLVAPRLRLIFEFRRRALEERFGSPSAAVDGPPPRP